MKKIIAISALMAALASANAMAVDANLTFSGSVTDGTCTLQLGDSSKTLTIPDIGVTGLQNTGNAYATQTSSTNFHFSGCPSSVSNVAATYTYTGSLYNPHNGIASGSTGVSLVVSQATPANMTANSYLAINGSSAAPNVAVINGSATIPVTVGIQQFYGTTVSAGNYSGTFNVTFSYS